MEWFSKNKFWLTGAGFFMGSAIIRFLAADQTPHPTGWDGYYYVMQVHSWLAFGYLQSPDFSFIYPYFATITYISGDPILGFKIGVAVISGLLVVAVFLSLVRRGVAFALVCLICCYLISSPLTTYFVLQFPKNALGLTFLTLFITYLDKKAIATIFFIAAIVTHRMTGGLAIVVFILYVVRLIPWKWTAGMLVALVLLSLLPGIIHISDLMRFEGQFVLTPHWVPFSFSEHFSNTLGLFFNTELVLVSVFIIYAIIKWRLIFSSPWLPIAIISIFPFFGSDLGYRFFLIAPIAFILMMTYHRGYPLINWSATVLLITISFYSWKSYKTAFDPPNDSYVTVTEVLSSRYKTSDYPLVIAHKSLAEIIIFKTDFDALNWLPPEDMPPQHVLRLINQVKYSDFRKHLDSDDLQKVRHVAGRYAALPEDVWQRFVDKATKSKDRLAIRRIYSGYNPMEQRPYFINKGKRR
jgi:hypothetical protein